MEEPGVDLGSRDVRVAPRRLGVEVQPEQGAEERAEAKLATAHLRHQLPIDRPKVDGLRSDTSGSEAFAELRPVGRAARLHFTIHHVPGQDHLDVSVLLGRLVHPAQGSVVVGHLGAAPFERVVPGRLQDVDYLGPDRNHGEGQVEEARVVVHRVVEEKLEETSVAVALLVLHAFVRRPDDARVLIQEHPRADVNVGHIFETERQADAEPAEHVFVVLVEPVHGDGGVVRLPIL